MVARSVTLIDFFYFVEMAAMTGVSVIQIQPSTKYLGSFATVA
jgi:hypothetical protein